MKTIEITIKGVSPLLQHRFGEDAEVGSRQGTRRQLVQRKTPREEAEKVCYRTNEGKFFFPGAAVARLLREAGGAHKLRGSRKSAKFVVPAAVLVVEDAIVLTNGDNKTPIADFEVDSRPVVIPATRGRVMRHRPRFDCWGASFALEINEDVLPPDFIHQLLVEGGTAIGIGDYRPERGGPFGRFHVISWGERK